MPTIAAKPLGLEGKPTWQLGATTLPAPQPLKFGFDPFAEDFGALRDYLGDLIKASHRKHDPNQVDTKDALMDAVRTSLMNPTPGQTPVSAIDQMIAERQAINRAVSGQPTPPPTIGAGGPPTPDLRGALFARYLAGQAKPHPKDIELPAGGEAPMDFDELMRRANALAPK